MFLDNAYLAENDDLFNEDLGLFKEEVDTQSIIDECEEVTVNYNESVMTETFESMMTIQEAAHEMNVGLLIAEHNYYVENGHYFTEADTTDAKKEDGKMAKAWGSVKDFFKKIGEVLVKWWRQFSLKIKELWLGHYMKKAKKLQEAMQKKSSFRKTGAGDFEAKNKEKKFSVYTNDIISKVKVWVNDINTMNTGLKAAFSKPSETQSYYDEKIDKKEYNEQFKDFYDSKAKTEIIVEPYKNESDVSNRLKDLLKLADSLHKNTGKAVNELNTEIKRLNKFGTEEEKKGMPKSRKVRAVVSTLMFKAGKTLSILNSVMANTIAWGYKVLGNSKEPEEKAAE